MYKVQIKRHSDDGVEKEIECRNYRHAERVEAGVQINLDHSKYYTEIVNEA